MHDTVDLEGRGIPAVMIATTEFVSGAAAQSESLGLEPASVFVTHPIQNQTDEELVALADAFWERVRAGLVAEA